MINKKINSSFSDSEFNTSNVFPVKMTINAFENAAENTCISPGGLVSNLNCPSEIPFCNCNIKTLEFLPEINQSLSYYLKDLEQNTKECDGIYFAFQNNEKYLKFFGFDYSNPNSRYNCSCEEFFGDSSVYNNNKFQGFTYGISGDYDNFGYFPYARRKSYTDGSTIYAFPPNVDVATKSPESDTVICEDQKLIGEYFKYYLEYSKTNATFWNTPPETPLLRQAQSNLLLYQRIKILVNGSFKIKPGNIISIAYPTGEHPVIKNSRFAGNWMVYKVKRIINAQRHSMYLFLMRDGLNENPDYDYGPLQFKKEA